MATSSFHKAVRIALLSRVLVAGVLFTISCVTLVAQSLNHQTPQSPIRKDAVGANGADTLVPNSVTNSREAVKYRRLWGIEDIHVRWTASGSLIRFSYRVVDKNKAKIFAEKRATPLLVDEQTNLALQVPVMEKIGQLRQVTTLQNGKEYWMAFSNKGRYVKPGSHVTLIIGSSRFNGLVVE